MLPLGKMPCTVRSLHTTSQIEVLSAPVPPASMTFCELAVPALSVLKRGARPMNFSGVVAVLP